ncbi:hypothetical protein [Candidatus Palauibacter sp.]|uniref:hypothetical protein n=1 Tax=Candidatus Palauibacter sp. TaxID=3101350 RepID=UPI003B02CA2F
MADEGRPQLRMWDEAGQETAIGSLDDGERRWQIMVIAEPVADDLVRGWLSFRLDDEKYDTAPVIMEETVELVIERAVELPEPMLQQLFGSARR